MEAIKLTEPTDTLVAKLYQCAAKAEIVRGDIVPMSPTGDLPSSAGFAIAASLRVCAKSAGGRAYTDNVAFLVRLPNRKSFSPDAAYYTGPRAGMKFLDQAPDFAAEVRSESDYGDAAEKRIAEKRADYFLAGTKVVWDVDLLDEHIVTVYRADKPDEPTAYLQGDIAEAEPAVPGWRMPVEELFE